MSDSWMPGDDPPLARLIFDRDKFRDGEPYPLRIHEETRLRRLIERAALRAQIEALYEWGEHKPAHKQRDRVPSRSCPLCIHIEWLHDRLAELER